MGLQVVETAETSKSQVANEVPSYLPAGKRDTGRNGEEDDDGVNEDGSLFSFGAEGEPLLG